MIVYGDPSYEASLTMLLERLRSRLHACAFDPSLDDLRALTIEAGAMEQAIHDGLREEGTAVSHCEAATDGAARAFLARWRDGSADVSPALASMDEALRNVPPRDVRLTVKTPEGFAFYALFPESYAAAAERWIKTHPDPGPVAVVGIRSIGTTLSALVAATLTRADVPAHRLTVRPFGHPFAREADIEKGDLSDARWVLVVDEGPGLSGSSMAAVAEAACRAGIPADRIAFFPGHGDEPGAQASERVLAWWARTPRFVAPTDSLRWNGRSMEETLAEATGDAEQVDEVTGGRWREFAFTDRSEWPAVAASFERRKIRVARHDGSAVLWKSVGFPVSGTTLGFAPSPWIEGEALHPEDSTPELLEGIGRHIAAVAGPPLSTREARDAWERLVEMLRVNLAEAGLPPFGDEAPTEDEMGPSAGDTRLAPAEWRRTAAGKIVKVGRIAATGDHTIVGRQPVAWDVAGAMVEWGLEPDGAAPLLAAAPSIPPDALRFYRLAYAAFRMGFCAMAASTAEREDVERLRRAEAFYRAALSRLLE